MSDSLNRIVVWDPKGEFWEGSLIDTSAEPKLTARGACVMPCAPELFKRGGNSGFVKRAWGAGYPLDQGSPRLHAPLTMLIFTGFPTLYWRARLLADASFDEALKEPGFRPGGMLRFVGDGSRELTHHASVTQRTPAIDVRELGPKDMSGGWTIGGSCSLSTSGDGHFGFAIYGYGQGLRIVWVAATLTADGI